MKITDAALKSRTTVFLFIVLIAIAGTYSYLSLPPESNPDIRIPYIIVTTTYQGVAPTDMETSVTQPIERKIKGLADVEKITSTTTEGVSVIVVEFKSDKDVDEALQRVKDRVDLAKADLPDDADTPIVDEVNISEWPIMILNISGTCGQVKLKELADDLEEKLETIRGVLDVQVIGGLERLITVEVDANRMAAYRIPANRIIGYLESENKNTTGGTIDVAKGKYQIRVPGEFRTPQEIDDLVVNVLNGKPIYLNDIATVVDGFEDRTTYSRINRRQSVSLSVQKRTGVSVIRVANAAKAIMEKESKLFPPGTEYSVTFDNTKVIRILVADLENNILSGMILVVIVLLLFMGGRNALFVAVAIPFSMLITFVILQMLGFTLNIVVLFSLVLALGMLVDNAIVVVENSYRHIELGEPRMLAVQQGTAEIAWPITTSTLTTVCAFLPLLFWPGIVGDFMSFLPKTVIITLCASLFVGLVINPVICSVYMKHGRRKLKEPAAPPRTRRSGFMRAYAGVLRWSIRHPVLVLMTAFAALVTMIWCFVKYGRGVEYFPVTEPDRAYIDVVAPDGVNIEESNRLVRKVEAVLAKYGDIKYTITSVGSMGQGGASFGAGGGSTPNKSRISLEFVDRKDRSMKSSALVEKIRADLHDFVGAEVRVKKEEGGPPTGPPVNLEISGDDYVLLAEYAHQAQRLLRTIPGIVNIQNDLEGGQPELRIRVNRRLAALHGLTTSMVGTMAKMALFGIKVGVYREGEDEYDIRARFQKRDRRDLSLLNNLLIANVTDKLVPLSSVAEVEYVSGMGSIRRIDQKRTVTVSADVQKGYNAIELRNQAKQKIDQMARTRMIRGYTFTFTGQQEKESEDQAFLGRAFIIALFLILIVLVAQFDSITRPMIIMISVVLSLIGVFLGLLVVKIPFGIIMMGIGVISLAGVVVNNSIVLVDFVEKLRARGLPRDEALVESGLTRLRPVLLTAITTILGLAPMAVGVSVDFRMLFKGIVGRVPGIREALRLKVLPGLRDIVETNSQSSEWWSPMAVAVIFGLGVATVLTLVVVPTLYRLFTGSEGSASAPEEVEA